MTSAAIRQEREQVLKELTGLEQIRRGSVTEQHIQTVGSDGIQRTRGPYPLYTFKEDGQTFSRRLHDRAEIAVYRQQIQHWRRFNELVERLRVLGEQLSDLAVQEQAVKKTPNTKSKKNSKRPASSNG
jgi:hypothetical protein